MASHPTADDFPASLNVLVVPPPPSQATTNILLVLHGLGGNEAPFAQFARQLALPDVCAIAIRGLQPLPFGLEGFHWADDLVFDSDTGSVDPETAVDIAARVLLEAVIDNVLIEKYSIKSRNIHIFGFGQGGTVALETAMHMSRASDRPSTSKELGGVISVGGALSNKSPPMLDPRCGTPILLCKGTNNSNISKATQGKVSSCFANAEIVSWAKKGDGMPANREEVLPLMRFWGRTLRKAAPAGTVEIG